jgi:hypothetical protein
MTSVKVSVRPFPSVTVITAKKQETAVPSCRITNSNGWILTVAVAEAKSRLFLSDHYNYNLPNVNVVTDKALYENTVAVFK